MTGFEAIFEIYLKNQLLGIMCDPSLSTKCCNELSAPYGMAMALTKFRWFCSNNAQSFHFHPK